MSFKSNAALISGLLATVSMLGCASSDAPNKIRSSQESISPLTSSGSGVKSGYGLCWRTGSQTLQVVDDDCDYEKLVLKAETLFDFDKATVKPEGRKLLDSMVAQAKGKGTKLAGVKVIGHTDSVGANSYNKGLSDRRAAAVKEYLVSKGIPAKLIVTEAKGELAPIADNKTPAGQARNRRIEVELGVLRGVK